MKQMQTVAKHDWAEVRAAGNEAELLIYGDIGESWDGESVTAKKIVDELAKLLDAEYLNVRINSYGGSVSDGMAIYNAIWHHPAAVTVDVDGVAVSSASLIAMAGDTVRMAENSLLMIHAPWAMAIGNATDMREMADVLDKYSEAMASAYQRNSIERDTALGLLTDGEDHWYTPGEALAAGFIDDVTEALPVAASIPERYRPARAAAAIPTDRRQLMSTEKKPAAAPLPADPKTETLENVTKIEDAAVARERQRIQARNEQIKTAFTPLMRHEGFEAPMREVYDAVLADPTITADAAYKMAMDKLGEGVEPIAGHASVRIDAGLDARDKFRSGVSAVLQHRMGDGKDDRKNEFRGMALYQVAAKSLDIHGIATSGMTRSEIASKVLAAHSTSDFPYLLADAANKRLQNAYEDYPSTWTRVANTGEVSDFKTVNLIRMGSFNSLATIPEGQEYTQGTISEERETLTPATKGRYIQLTRQMIVNDDLNGFSRLASLLGRSAGRTVNEDVYGVINTNGNLSDGIALFHASHSNLAGTGAAISVATLSAGRSAMRKQTAPGTDATEYLNIMPSVLLVPVVLEDTAREVVSSDYDTDVAASRKRNPIRSWGPLEVVSDPVLDATSATAWYLVADPMDAPLLEVHFLDGQQTPYVDTEEEFLTDAIRWKVRLDYGVAANDYRGGYKNAGA